MSMSLKHSKRDDAKKHDRKAVTERKAPFADAMDFETSEAYNVLRTNIILSLPHKHRGNIVGTTSSAPHEGKSYTSVNLSYALAKNGMRTLLVSADMRKPTVESYYEVPMAPGLSNLLVGSVPPESLMKVIRPLPEYSENLYILPAGDIPPNPSELLGSESMKELTQKLTTLFDYVIVDLPPVTTVADPVVVAPYLDGILIVVNHAYTRRQSLIQALKQLRFSNVRILGFVYNGYSKHGGKRKNYGYKGYDYNGYDSSYDTKNRAKKAE